MITRLEGCGLVSTHPDHAQEPTATAQRHPQHVINRTRTGGVWLASVLFAALLGILMVVIPPAGTDAPARMSGPLRSRRTFHDRQPERGT